MVTVMGALGAGSRPVGGEGGNLRLIVAVCQLLYLPDEGLRLVER